MTCTFLRTMHDMQNRHVSPTLTGPGADLLTATHISERLGVDTSTIYRMAADGRLPAVKVGRQWRFPRAEVERALSVGISLVPPARDDVAPSDTRSEPVVTPAHPVAPPDDAGPVPAEFAETVTALVAESLGVMMVVTDLTGRPLTPVANPCPWFNEHGEDPEVLQGCIDEWRDLADDLTFTPTFRMGPQGFRCARAFVRRDNQLLGMVLAGGLGPTRAADAPNTGDGLYHLDAAAEARVLHVLPQVAAAVSKVAGHGSDGAAGPNFLPDQIS